jgi:hypothetical protein
MVTAAAPAVVTSEGGKAAPEATEAATSTGGEAGIPEAAATSGGVEARIPGAGEAKPPEGQPAELPGERQP